MSIDAVPASIDMDEVEQCISRTEGVKSWHNRACGLLVARAGSATHLHNAYHSALICGLGFSFYCRDLLRQLRA